MRNTKDIEETARIRELCRMRRTVKRCSNIFSKRCVASSTDDDTLSALLEILRFKQHDLLGILFPLMLKILLELHGVKFAS